MGAICLMAAMIGAGCARADAVVVTAERLNIRSEATADSRAVTVVSAGETLKFIQSETGLLGSRIATDLEAMFDHYANHAFIPDVQFADVFYKSVSIYSDPLAIYSTSGPA